jgi:hypothetical protein
MRALRDVGLDVVLLALLVPSAVVILMVCLLGLFDLSKNRDRDVLGQLLLLRGGIAHTVTRETVPDMGAQITWQKSRLNTRHASLAD